MNFLTCPSTNSFKNHLITRITISIGLDKTSNITRVRIRRNLKALTNQFAQYELCYGNTIISKFVVPSGGGDHSNITFGNINLPTGLGSLNDLEL